MRPQKPQTFCIGWHLYIIVVHSMNSFSGIVNCNIDFNKWIFSLFFSSAIYVYKGTLWISCKVLVQQNWTLNTEHIRLEYWNSNSLCQCKRKQSTNLILKSIHIVCKQTIVKLLLLLSVIRMSAHFTLYTQQLLHCAVFKNI